MNGCEYLDANFINNRILSKNLKYYWSLFKFS